MRNASYMAGPAAPARGGLARLSRPARWVAATLLLSALSACSATSTLDTATTQSIDPASFSPPSPNTVLPLAVEQSMDALKADGEAMAESITHLEGSHLEGMPMTWRNEQTGSSGMMSAFNRDVRSDCLTFRALRNSDEGVSSYLGTACPTAPGGSWSVTLNAIDPA